MDSFHSYYWKIEDLERKDAEAARILTQGDDAASTPAAFERLLASDSPAARGVALDQYAHHEARGRFGTSNPLRQYRDRVLGEARAQLRSPPVTATSPLGTVTVGANHASALGVLGRLGDASDLPRITCYLVPSQDFNVLEAACLAVDHCLEGAATQIARDVGAHLATILQDPAADDGTRVMVLAPFRSWPALDQIDMLLDTVRHGALLPAIHAAWALAGQLEDETELRRLIASWPADAPYPADEVRAAMGSR